MEGERTGDFALYWGKEIPYNTAWKGGICLSHRIAEGKEDLGLDPTGAPVPGDRRTAGLRDDEERGVSKIRRMPLRAAPGAYTARKYPGDRGTKGL